MDQYIVSITVVGLVALGMTYIPLLTKKINISYSLVFLLFGIIIYSFVDELPWPDPKWQENYVIHITELVVIIALMGIGLKIDHPFSFRNWKVPFRLVTITMLLSIALMAVMSMWGLGFDLASAVLLGAVLAPTDPVLAADVQVGPPNKGKNDDVRFALTAEAGMNDGMAFPFTWLAISLAIATQSGESWLVDWLWKDVLYRILAGAAVGFLLGKLIVYLFFVFPDKYNLARVRDGLVAISITLIAYGFAELIQGYGFIAVFVAAITIRNYEMEHEYHDKLHQFTDQIERILLAILLTLFGGSLVNGVLDDLTWEMAALGLGFLLIIRPVSGLAALIGIPLRLREKFAISFFGIRGIGSFFYLAFALDKTEFAQKEEIWSITAFIVLLSIVIHGLTAALAMKKLKPGSDQRQKETE